jgi:hypothetical protein
MLGDFISYSFSVKLNYLISHTTNGFLKQFFLKFLEILKLLIPDQLSHPLMQI